LIPAAAGINNVAELLTRVNSLTARNNNASARPKLQDVLGIFIELVSAARIVNSGNAVLSVLGKLRSNVAEARLSTAQSIEGPRIVERIIINAQENQHWQFVHLSILSYLVDFSPSLPESR
jgi:hypothetical protein